MSEETNDAINAYAAAVPCPRAPELASRVCIWVDDRPCACRLAALMERALGGV